MLQAVTAVQSWLVTRRSRWSARRAGGQTTAEYALVLVGVAAIALLLAAWAARTNRIGRLFDAVLDSILDDVT